MFWRMVRRALFRQKGKMLMIALTVALGTSLSTAMLNVMMDVGDKVNQELKTYGANITVMPREASLLDDLYGMDEGLSDKYLREDELGNIKTIFWAFNIVDFAPYLETKVSLETGDAPGGGSPVKLTGTWFSRDMELPTGETLTTGMANMKNWWEVRGRWLSGEEDAVMAGSLLARRLGIGPGDRITVHGAAASRSFTVAAVFNSGSAEDETLFAPLAAAQELAGRPGRISRAEVSALTTPDNELSRRAAQDPRSLSIKEWETWYCTAYVSAICYQIDEALTGSVSRPVRQVAESEGAILEKTELLMLLITVLSLLASALGISNLVSAAVIERSREIGLLKAIGGDSAPVSLLILTEILITGAVGGAAGYFAGLGFAQIIGQSVFGSAIDIKGAVIPLVIFLIALVTLAGSLPAIRYILSLRPAEVLHGR